MKPFNIALESCVATVVLSNGTITAQGVVTSRSGVPQPATFAVTGGTGSFDGAHGTVKVTFGKTFDILIIVLQ